MRVITVECRAKVISIEWTSIARLKVECTRCSTPTRGRTTWQNGEIEPMCEECAFNAAATAIRQAFAKPGLDA